MRKTQTKEKPIVKPKQFPNKVLSLEMYFRDASAIKASLASLIDLSTSNGWHILQSYLTEQKNNLIQSLQNIDPTDKNIALLIAKTQSQIEFIDTLLTLPQLIIDSYNEIESDNLDPYSQS
ncbi:MAG: hypothetical protein QW076_00305 [Candidatus Anstonellales archaeon]